MPEKYVAVPRDMPVYGMTYEVCREGSRWPIALTGDRRSALIVAAAFTQAAAIVEAEIDRVSRELRDLELERGEDLT